MRNQAKITRATETRPLNTSNDGKYVIWSIFYGKGLNSMEFFYT